MRKEEQYMSRATIYKEAYKILERITPLRRDCGRLCGRACCDGGEEDKGMLLYPGEEELLTGQSDWLTIVPIQDLAADLLLATCDDICPRDMRPLSCRVFPLIPYLTENDILLVKLDPRARGVCPLARAADKKELRPEFIRAVRKASSLLIKDPKIKGFIYDLSRMLDEYTSQPWFI